MSTIVPSVMESVEGVGGEGGEGGCGVSLCVGRRGELENGNFWEEVTASEGRR